MCRERPGPRCSNTATLRMNKAKNRMAEMERRMASCEEGNRNPTKRLKHQFTTAQRRLAQATRVYHASPAGHRALQESIERQYDQLNRMDPGEPGSFERNSFNAQQARIQAAEQAHNDAVVSRANSYADLRLARRDAVIVRHDGAGTRREERAVSYSRGGTSGYYGHPAKHDAVLESTTNRELQLSTWDDSDLERADTWVDDGGITEWGQNNGSSLPRGAGRRAVPSESRFVRMNLPDGVVTEARIDHHITKNNEGKYVVSERSTVGMSWEDASPIDKTYNQPGHLLVSDNGVTRTSETQEISKTDSLEEAQAALAAHRAANDGDLAKKTASKARSMHIQRAATLRAALQTRGTGSIKPKRLDTHFNSGNLFVEIPRRSAQGAAPRYGITTDE